MTVHGACRPGQDSAGQKLKLWIPKYPAIKMITTTTPMMVKTFILLCSCYIIRARDGFAAIQVIVTASA
jgi:hypothetical protein